MESIIITGANKRNLFNILRCFFYRLKYGGNGFWFFKLLQTQFL